MFNMQESEIYDELNQLFRELFSDDDITVNGETTADDVEGWDSFNHLSVIVAVETRFGIKMKTSELDGLANVGQLVSAIQAKLPPG